MIDIKGKQYRNLQEQVLFNSDRITLLEDNTKLAELGIRIMSATPLNSPSDLPENYEGQYGDAYLVGTIQPYHLYIWTRTAAEGVTGAWYDFGELNAPSVVPGPIGPQGIQGLPGVRGSLWYSQSGAPTNIEGVNDNDQALDGITGNIYQFVNGRWQRTGNIRGPQGIQGVQGPEGPQGVQGVQGPMGPKGDMGQFIKIVGTVNLESQLPPPTEATRTNAYLVGDNKELYVIIGEGTEEDPLAWYNAGSIAGGGGTKIYIDGTMQNELDVSNIKVNPSYSTGENTEVELENDGIVFHNLSVSGTGLNEDPAIPGEADIKLPIVDDGEGLIYLNPVPSSDDNSKNTSIEISINQNNLNQYITNIAKDVPAITVQIEAPSTSTNGQLTEEQLNTLNSNPNALLYFNNEVYRLQDVQHEEGYIVYSHIGWNNSSQISKVKCITITVNTRGWVLTETEIPEKTYLHKLHMIFPSLQWYSTIPIYQSSAVPLNFEGSAEEFMQTNLFSLISGIGHAASNPGSAGNFSDVVYLYLTPTLEDKLYVLIMAIVRGYIENYEETLDDFDTVVVMDEVII